MDVYLLRISIAAIILFLFLAGCDLPTSSDHRENFVEDNSNNLPTELPLGLSLLDALGCGSGWVEFPRQPVTVLGGSEDRVYRRNFTFELPPATRLTKVSSFIGTDAGDHFEADFEIFSVLEGIRTYQRSEHIRAESYDAWKSEEVSYACAVGCAMNVVLLGRVTDTNTSEQNLDSFGKLRARFHFGLRMQLCVP